MKPISVSHTHDPHLKSVNTCTITKRQPHTLRFVITSLNYGLKLYCNTSDIGEIVHNSLVPRPSLSLSSIQIQLTFTLEAGKKEVLILSFLPPQLLLQKKAREKAWERG